MTSYEIVRRAVEFGSPERIAIRFPALGIDDTYGLPLQAAAGWEAPEPDVDEWGCLWHKPDPASGVANMGQPRAIPSPPWTTWTTTPGPTPPTISVTP